MFQGIQVPFLEAIFDADQVGGNFFVESIAFSSDAKYLLIGMESILPNTPATVVFELVDGLYER